MLRNLARKSTKRCKNDTCNQYRVHHSRLFYHQSGYVELKMRFSQEASQNPETNAKKMNQSVDKKVFVQVQCEKCKVGIFPKKALTKQLQELSFYSFLEQFFYNNDTLQIANVVRKDGKRKCPHAFHSSCKVIFLIDILRIEFLYHPVDTYELDLVCFKDLAGTVTKDMMTSNFVEAKGELQKMFEETIQFIMKANEELKDWLTQVARLEYLNADVFALARTILETIINYQENLQAHMEEYKKLALECIEEFRADNEFHLNKLHKTLTSRVSEYILILKTIYYQSFDELLVLLQKEP